MTDREAEERFAAWIRALYRQAQGEYSLPDAVKKRILANILADYKKTNTIREEK